MLNIDSNKNDHAGRESACGREMGNNEFSRSGLKEVASLKVRMKKL